MTAISEMC